MMVVVGSVSGMGKVGWRRSWIVRVVEGSVSGMSRSAMAVARLDGGCFEPRKGWNPRCGACLMLLG